MRRFKFFIDFDKEEKWLMKMAKQGYRLVDASFGYEFRLAEPEESVIKIDYRRFKKREDFIDYCTLFEDSGWKHIAGKKSSGTQYFRRINEENNNDIFSDKISKVGRNKRLSNMFMEMAICYFPILIALITTDTINTNAFLNPKQLYFTPGLWEMAGYSFWSSFLFETPFALMRGFAWLVIPITITMCLIFGFKANKTYKHNLG